MCSDAQLAREMAKVGDCHHCRNLTSLLTIPPPSLLQLELSRQEQSMAESRREREKVLCEYRRQAEEKKEFQEKVEKRVSC